MFTSYFRCKECKEFFKIKTSGKNIDNVICPACGDTNVDYATDKQINKLDEDQM